MVFYYEYDTVVGKIRLAEEEDALISLSLAGKAQPDAFLRKGELTYKETDLLCRTYLELQEYLAGERREFDIPLRFWGTPFQETVWKALQTIPYGETRSYGQIAAQIGKPGASRAVGMANHFNPIAIIIPCHRVIGADGTLTGYGGGLDIKEILLRIEGIL